MTERDLLTVTDRVTLLVQALSDNRDQPPVLKLYLPDGAAIWLISEADPDDADRVYGLFDLGLGFPELGYASLREITALRGPLGLAVERDKHFVSEKPLSVHAAEARSAGRIVT